ncbi:MAG TPA: glycosyltransferase family 4 protein [Bacillota bacterium]|nr:glycosyltransferase family 4 protein [Bacillota bacterium]
MKAVIVTNQVRRYLVGFSTMIEPLKDLGFEVIWAANFKNLVDDPNKIPCRTYQVDFHSNPLHPGNFIAYQQLASLLRNERIDLLHCNTPIGGLLGRLCARQARIHPVIYTAHGFHFFSGAPLLNQIVYKSAERFLARYTDVLVTINEEDFNAARKFRLRKRGRVYKVHGVGVHTNVGVQPGGQEHYRHRLYVREKLAIHRSAIVVVSVGELNRNKNNEVIIRALGKLERNDIYYVLCGEGKLKDDLYRLAKRLGLGERVRFLGYRTDIEDILLMADIFVLPSFREGLSRALMEAMACGLPCVVSAIRGNKDLIDDGEGGILVPPSDVDAFCAAIRLLADDESIRHEMGAHNRRKVLRYSVENVKYEMKAIYETVICTGNNSEKG